MNSEIRLAARFVGWCLLPVTLLVGGALLLAYSQGVPISTLLRDPAAVGDLPWYTGVLSTVGVMLWAAAAAIGWFAWWLARPEGGRLVWALAVSSTALAADDALLIHEGTADVLGLSEEVLLGALGAAVVGLLAFGWREIVSHDARLLLVMAVGALAVSLYQDQAGSLGLPTLPGGVIAEDLAKFVGILAWLAFSWCVAASVVRGRVGRVGEPAANAVGSAESR